MREYGRKGASLLLAFILCLSLLMGMAAGVGAEEITEVSLTVTASDNFSDEAAEEDFKGADVVIDLYQIAGMTALGGGVTYDFTPMDPYGSLALDGEMTAEAWQTVAEDAAAIARNEGTPIVTGRALGEKIVSSDAGSPLGLGLYLVIAHGRELENFWNEDGSATLAEGAVYSYAFTPLLIALPTNTSPEDTSLGEWVADAELLLKYVQTERFGEITIYKTVRNFEGEEATFVFSVEAEKNGVNVYSNVATIHMGQSGTLSATLDRIPAGSRVTVTEVYSGGRFELVGSGVAEIESVTVGEENAVSFENTYNRKIISGHGIQNHFTYSAESGWQWEKQ